MKAEEEITKFYNDRLEKYKENLINLLCEFLGEEHRELITTKINNLSIVYFVNKKSISKCLENDNLDRNERKLLEYFLEKMETSKDIDIDAMSNEELIAQAKTLGSNDILDKLLIAIEAVRIGIKFWGDIEFQEGFKLLRAEIKKICKTSPKHQIIGTYGDFNEATPFSYKDCSLKSNDEKGKVALPIYSKDFSPDNDFLWAILRFILNSANKPIELKHSNIDLGEKVYNKIIYYFSIILAEQLHKKGIYIFDNKNLTRNSAYYEKIKDEEAYQKIKKYFGKLFARFLFEPNEVMKLVGEENFRKFALWFVYLAPILDEDIEYDEEKDEDVTPVEIPYDDLDVDIMEVLDDMYLEYLRHLDISLTTIDIKKLIFAKKALDYDKKENEKDSKYYHITLLFKYLEKYGNAEIRFFSYDKTCEVLKFTFDECGNIKITKYLELYDSPLFNYDKTLYSEAKLKERIKVFEYDESEFDIALSSVLYYSLYHETTIRVNRFLKPKRSNDITKLYELVLPMFDLNLKELIEWVLSDGCDTGRLNILLHERKILEDKFSPEIIELKIQTLKEKIREVNAVWKKVNNARNKEELQIADKEWLALNRKAGR